LRFKDHIKDSILYFGKPFEEVHKWLDEYAAPEKLGGRHRKKRHHKKGIDEARALFGDEGAKAAERHILIDLEEEYLWKPEDGIPEDEEDYNTKGYF